MGPVTQGPASCLDGSPCVGERRCPRKNGIPPGPKTRTVPPLRRGPALLALDNDIQRGWRTERGIPDNWTCQHHGSRPAIPVSPPPCGALCEPRRPASTASPKRLVFSPVPCSASTGANWARVRRSRAPSRKRCSGGEHDVATPLRGCAGPCEPRTDPRAAPGAIRLTRAPLRPFR